MFAKACNRNLGLEIIAHRGYLLFFPENTLVAFWKALSLGANGIELDIQMSRDKIPVVIHDESVDRTTNGFGNVASLSLKELKQLDAGAKFSFAFRGEKIPTLRESLLTIKDKGKVYIDLKKSVDPSDLEKVLYEIYLCEMEKWVTLVSFDFSQLELLRQLNSSIILGKLLLPNDFNLDRMIASKISLACAPYQAFLQITELLPILKLNNIIPNAYGIADRKTAKLLIRKGIIILECDKPL